MMRDALQKTLEAPVEFAGAGLHSGQDCHIVLRPASENAGIIFRRLDISRSGENRDNGALVKAAPQFVSHCDHGTTLTNPEGVSVATVEHLMAALALSAVDNVLIDVTGPEIPILDGSSGLFVSAIKNAGLKSQTAPRARIVIEEPLRVADGERFIEFEPAAGFSLDISIAFDDCLIGRQSLSMHFDDPRELVRLANSRTFCRLHEVEALRRAGLIRGGSLDNSIVVDGEKLLNGEKLRDPQEFVLHKALDLLGDLYLLGGPVCGTVRAEKPGHDLNTRAAMALARHMRLGGQHSMAQPVSMAASA